MASWQQAYANVVPSEYLASLSVPAREASWQAQIQADIPRVLVARGDGGVAGFVAYGPYRDAHAPPGWGEIWALYVEPSSWSSGTGRALWLAAREQLRLQGTTTVALWVLSENLRGRRFYTAAGFLPEPASEKEFTLGGASLKEIRMVFRSGA